jgi:hypothetical protein
MRYLGESNKKGTALSTSQYGNTLDSVVRLAKAYLETRLHQGPEMKTKTEQRYQDNLARRNTIEPSIDFGKLATIIHYHKCRKLLHIYTNHTPIYAFHGLPFPPFGLKHFNHLVNATVKMRLDTAPPANVVLKS